MLCCETHLGIFLVSYSFQTKAPSTGLNFTYVNLANVWPIELHSFDTAVTENVTSRQYIYIIL